MKPQTFPTINMKLKCFEFSKHDCEQKGVWQEKQI